MYLFNKLTSGLRYKSSVLFEYEKSKLDVLALKPEAVPRPFGQSCGRVKYLDLTLPGLSIHKKLIARDLPTLVTEKEERTKTKSKKSCTEAG